ncbi:MAG: hypothetical protein OSJ70_09135 [Bacilli bacterium]|nr:hypothetical protein [Bacilli bacterium]
MGVMLVYGYYAFIFIAIGSTIIYDFKYEKLKKKEGYKNKYRGTYKFKGLFDGHVFKTLSDYFVKFFVPGFQLEPLIDLFLFKSSSKVDFGKEKLTKAIEWVDPSIIDVDFKIVSEEQLESLEPEKTPDMVEEVVSELNSPSSAQKEDREKSEYLEAVDEYIELYEQYCAHEDKASLTGEEPHLK